MLSEQMSVIVVSVLPFVVVVQIVGLRFVVLAAVVRQSLLFG